MKMTRKRKSSKAFAVLAVLLAVLCAAVWLPRAFGLDGYYVKTGSMEPNIPKGSAVYIEPVGIEEIIPGTDVLLFSDKAGARSFTHRVMSIDYENNLIYTKGDANAVADDLPTSFEHCNGRVKFYIPYFGYVLQVLNSEIGIIAIVVFYIIWAAVETENYKSRKKAVKA